MSLIDEVKKIPIREIIQLRIEVQRNDAICPFHNDTKMGSFKISDAKNIYKCFTCGVAGDGISFISKYDGISYLDAAYQIAYELKLITPTEYKNKKIRRNIKPNVQTYTVNNNSLLSELQTEDIINLVYQVIINRPLSDEDLKYLKEVRQLTDEDITVGKYFTMPTENEIFKDINKVLKAKGLNKDILLGVPGFYMEGDKYRFNECSGVGIPIFDYDRKILGIQVRTQVKKGEGSRYIWVSSSFANGKNDKKYGSSAGSPMGVVYPRELQENAILITEGNFKAVKFANRFGIPCITVQGVNSYEGIQFLVEDICEKFFQNKEVKILVGYDADMMGNLNVFKASVGMVKQLKDLNCKMSYLIWDEDYGKGLDDLIIASNEDKLIELEAAKYQNKYLEVIRGIQSENKDLSDKALLEKELKKEFFA